MKKTKTKTKKKCASPLDETELLSLLGAGLLHGWQLQSSCSRARHGRGQTQQIVCPLLCCKILLPAASFCKMLRLVMFFFPYNPHPPPSRQTPRPSHPRELDFGPFRVRFGCFGSVWVRLGPFWVRFGSVSGLFRVRFGVLGGVGVGSGREASVREKNITSLDAQIEKLQSQ